MSLTKVPAEIREKYKTLDEPMRRLMGELPQKASKSLADSANRLRYFESYREKESFEDLWYDEMSDAVLSSKVYDQYRESSRGPLEYRYADFPLSLGEAIMLNHALFGALLHTSSVPITDDPFHNSVLNLKIKRAMAHPTIGETLRDLATARELKIAKFVLTTLTDIQLGIVSPRLPMEEILQCRQDNKTALERPREELAAFARRVETEP